MKIVLKTMIYFEKLTSI